MEKITITDDDITEFVAAGLAETRPDGNFQGTPFGERFFAFMLHLTKQAKN